MSEVLKKFGKYFLLDHLAQGGFADIFRARLATPDGASRIIVIKRIQAGYDANSEFIQMFKSETKTSMALNHPNIVQVFDVGEETGQPFIAMELVNGRNLRQILSRIGEQQQQLSVIHAAYIIEQAAQALSYAHEFRDPLTGVPLNLVHRDISPQNIMVSYDGTVKLIDFGIAKATTNTEHTRTGVIKGKPSYFSPEQITGEELDGRSDLFALGIVLWELLTTKKLFFGDSDIAIIKQIEACNSYVKAPSSENPKIPKALDNIVLKSLQRNRDHRYQRLSELQRDLHRFILDNDPSFHASEISTEIRKHFSDLIDEDNRKLKALNERAESLIRNQPKETPPSRAPQAAGKANAPRPTRVSNQVFEAPTTESPFKLELENNPRRPVTQRSTREVSPQARSTSLTPVTSARSKSSTTSNTPYSANRGQTGSLGQRISGKKFLLPAVAAILGLFVISSLKIAHIPIISSLTESLFENGEATLQLDGQGDIQQLFVDGEALTVPPGSQLPYSAQGIPAGKRVEIRVVGTQGQFTTSWTFARNEITSRPVIWQSSQASTQGTPEATDPNRIPSGSESNNITSTQDSTKNDTKEIPSGQIGLRINGFPNGSGTQIIVNGNTVGNGKFIGGVAVSPAYTIQIVRDGWTVDEKQFNLANLQSRDGMVDFELKPDGSRGHAPLEVREPNGGEISIYSVEKNELIHKGRIDREEILYQLPEGRYRVTRSDSATAQSQEDLITVVRDVRGQLSPWKR